MALPPAPMPMEPPPQMPPQAPPQAQLMPPQPQGMPPGMHGIDPSVLAGAHAGLQASQLAAAGYLVGGDGMPLNPGIPQ